MKEASIKEVNMKDMMQALSINQWGDADSFELTLMPIPALEADDVLVKVAYAGLNPADWKMRAGHLAKLMPDLGFPLVMGFDASGTVVATGKKVKHLVVGDRVASGNNLFHSGKPGSYAQYMVVSEKRAVKLPDSVSLESAATLATAGITAWQALFVSSKGALNNAKGKKILINGASGGVGSFAVQLAKWAGAEVATTSSTGNLSYVKSLGADYPIDYKTQDVTQALNDWAPEGVDFILDAVGAGSLTNPLTMLKAGGMLMSIATITDDGDIEASMMQAQEKGLQHIYAIVSDEGMNEQLSKILLMTDSGQMTLPPTEVYSMSDIAVAHKQMEMGHAKGKLVLEVTH